MGYWSEAVSAAGGAFVAWWLGRRESVRLERNAEIARVAAKAVVDSGRLAVIETTLPRVEADVKEIKVTAKDTNAKLDAVLSEGRLRDRKIDALQRDQS